MKSPEFVAPDYSAGYAKLEEQRPGQGWSLLVDVLRYIPLANEGDRHSKLRRDFARLISARSPAAKESVAALLGKLIPLVFRDGVSADLIGDLVRPLTDTLFSELIGTPLPVPAPDGASASQIFDPSIGLNRVIRMRDEVARVSKAFADTPPATSPDYATALVTVGHDSVLGSLGSSLVAILGEGEGSRLCDLDYPASLPKTGVPIVERVASRDCAIQGFSFARGDRFRLFLDACPARGCPGEDAPFFGKGRHICLGKDLSLWLWRSLTQALATVPLKLDIVEAHFRRHDFVFSLYERIEVSIHG